MRSVIIVTDMDRGGRVQAVDAIENGCGRSAASAVVVAQRRTAVGAPRAGGMGNAARRLTRRLECAPGAGQDHAAVLTLSGDELIGVFAGMESAPGRWLLLWRSMASNLIQTLPLNERILP